MEGGTFARQGTPPLDDALQQLRQVRHLAERRAEGIMRTSRLLGVIGLLLAVIALGAHASAAAIGVNEALWVLHGSSMQLLIVGFTASGLLVVLVTALVVAEACCGADRNLQARRAGEADAKERATELFHMEVMPVMLAYEREGCAAAAAAAANPTMDADGAAVGGADTAEARGFAQEWREQGMRTTGGTRASPATTAARTANRAPAAVARLVRPLPTPRQTMRTLPPLETRYTSRAVRQDADGGTAAEAAVETARREPAVMRHDDDDDDAGSVDSGHSQTTHHTAEPVARDLEQGLEQSPEQEQEQGLQLSADEEREVVVGAPQPQRRDHVTVDMDTDTFLEWRRDMQQTAMRVGRLVQPHAATYTAPVGARAAAAAADAEAALRVGAVPPQGYRQRLPSPKLMRERSRRFSQDGSSSAPKPVVLSTPPPQWPGGSPTPRPQLVMQKLMRSSPGSSDSNRRLGKAGLQELADRVMQRQTQRRRTPPSPHAHAAYTP